MKIAVAYIRGPRGLRGELTATLYRPSSQSLKPGLDVTLKKDERELQATIEQIKFLPKGLGIKFAGFDNVETAVIWKGAEVLVEEEQLEPLDKNEFYHFEIVGAEVFESDGKKIGIVKELDSSAGNTLLIVDTGGEEIMIPFVGAFVKSVDIEKKKIMIEKLEGLY